MPRWMKGLAAALVSLAVLYGFVRMAGSGRPAAAVASSLDPVRLRLETAQVKVTLEKRGDRWNVMEPLSWPADEEAVRRLAGGLQGLALENEVTRRTESFGQYDLDDAKGARVQAWAAGAKEPFEVVLGKGAGFTGKVYVRYGKEAVVYLASGLSREAVDQPLSRWRDRRVLDDREVSRVRGTRGKTSFTLERSSAGWTVDGRPADDGKAQAFLSALRLLEADDFVDPPATDPKKYGLEAPPASFEVWVSSGAPVVFSLGKNEDPRPLRKEGAGSFFLVPSYRVSDIDKSAKDFSSPVPKLR